MEWKAGEVEVLNEYQFLTAKQVVYLVNMSEKDFIRQKNKWLAKIHAWVEANVQGPIIPYSAQFENKLAELPDDAAREKYIQESGAKKSQLDKIVTTGYNALHLIHFFTCGEDEVKCWTVRQGEERKEKDQRKREQERGTKGKEEEKREAESDAEKEKEERERKRSTKEKEKGSVIAPSGASVDQIYVSLIHMYITSLCMSRRYGDVRLSLFVSPVQSTLRARVCGLVGIGSAVCTLHFTGRVVYVQTRQREL